MTTSPPEIIEVDSQRIEELLSRADSNTLSEEDTELMRQVFASYRHFFDLARDKDTTIARLRKMLFGASSEKTDKVVGDSEDAQQAQSQPSDDGCGEQDAAGDDTAADDDGSQRCPVMAATLRMIIAAPIKSPSRTPRWLSVMIVPTASKGRCMRKRPACWFVSWDALRWGQPFTGCKSCAVICAARSSPHRSRRRLDRTSTTTPWPA